MAPAQIDSLNLALAGRYTVRREIGRGGMATVYLADDLRHARQVAIKVLRPEVGNVVGLDRFTREIAVAARLSHPHIVALHDSGKAGESLFYVMPYIAGESLRQRMNREGRLAIEDTVTIIRQVASALDYAHALHVVHRDIKPENILLFEGEAMVADFGIALAASTTDTVTTGRLTTEGLALGTPFYMSPEQAAGDARLDARSDLYSLACVLYEMLAGEPPFTGSTPQAIIARRFTEGAPAIRRVRPGIPPHVELAIQRALSRDAGERFATCRELVDALDHRGTTAPPLPSVAVLPFLNLSPDPANDYFADGITEDVIAQLSKVRSLKVISRSSAMRFRKREPSLREIGQVLGVATLLDGSVRRAGDKVRIVSQLVDGSTEETLWSETYDRELTDLFAIQSDVALQIASALRAELSPREEKRISRQPTQSLVAYQHYLRGRQSYGQYTESGIRRGLEYFRMAIDEDPRFALAWTGIALAYAELAAGAGGSSLTPAEATRSAREAANHALAIDPELGEAHGVLALLQTVYDFDWQGSEATFRRALELSPGSAEIHDHYGWLLGALERHDEAIAEVTKAQELDPLMHRSDVATSLLRAGRLEEARAAAAEALVQEPGHGRGLSTLGWALFFLGRKEEGIARLAEAVHLNPGHTLFLSQLGMARAMAGAVDDARRILAALEEQAHTMYVPPYHIAYVHVGLGDYDRAMDYLERAWEERGGGLYNVKGSFLLTSLRGHPRFEALLERMGLPPSRPVSS